MKLPAPHVLQKIKNYVHGLQALLIFLAWALTIAVFTKPGNTDGRSKYYFALCFLSIPPLIYLTATPIFERTRKFVNPYASAVIEIIYSILWFAAFIAVTTWTRSGIKAGEAAFKDEKDPAKRKSGCAAFAFGSESKCTVSRATIWIGVLIFLLFLPTTFLSVKSAAHFKRTGSLPAHNPPSGPSGPVDDDQTKYAFSANPHDDLDEDIEEHPHPTAKPSKREDDEYALLHTDTEDGTHPGRPLSWGRDQAPVHPPAVVFDATDTSYQGRSRPPPSRKNVYDSSNASSPYLGRDQRQAGDPFRDDVPLSHEQRGYGSGGGRIQFPDAEYHR